MEIKSYKIKDICSIKSGKRIPLEMDFTLDRTDHPYIRARDIKNGTISTDNLVYLEERVYQKIKKYIIKSGDIAITIVGASVGDVAFADSSVDGYNLTENAVRLTNFQEDANSRFVFFQLAQKSFHDYMQTIAGAAAQPKLGIYKIERIQIALPDKTIQERIVDVIDSYDKLIRLNNERIKLLEQMAENLYKEWFVRFRFPGHESSDFENGIPTNWIINRFSSVANIMSGGTPNTDNEEYYGGDIPFYTPKDSIENYYSLDTITKITEDGLRHCNSKLYSKDTIMITARGTVGNINLLAVPMAMNQSCYALNSDIIHSQYFLFFMIKREILKLQKMASGGVFDTIIVKTFDHIKVVLPPEELINRFDAIVSPIMDTILSLVKQNSVLKIQRDLLLPRLMSGQLEV